MLSHLKSLHCSVTIDQPEGCAFTAAVTLDEYLTLVDETGRLARGDKRGAIPANLATILDRLRIKLDACLALMRSGGHFGLGSLGALASHAREALRRGAKWIIDSTASLYRDDQPTAVPNIAKRLCYPSISTPTHWGLVNR